MNHQNQSILERRARGHRELITAGIAQDALETITALEADNKRLREACERTTDERNYLKRLLHELVDRATESVDTGYVGGWRSLPLVHAIANAKDFLAPPASALKPEQADGNRQ
jgi:hypothetical protein